jgi:uncharacterized protein YciI
MLESTNALLATLIAVLRELKRSQQLLTSGSLPDKEEEELGPFVDQLHEALADLSSAYTARQSEHPSLISLDDLNAKIAAETLPGGVNSNVRRVVDPLQRGLNKT